MEILHRVWIIISLLCLLAVGSTVTKNDTGNECQVGRALRKQVKPTPLAGMCLKDIVSKLSKVLRVIGNDELGLTDFQEMLDKLDFISLPDEPDNSLKSLADNINAKLDNYLAILDKSLQIVLPILEQYNIFNTHTQNKRINSQRDKSTGLCSQIENDLAAKLESPQWKHIRVLPFSKRPGIICGQAGPVRNIGSLFLSQCDKPKNVIVLMEHGAFMSEDDIALARATAKAIVDMLSDSDSVTIIGLAGRGFVHCKNGLVKSTDFNKSQLIQKIDATMRTDSNESLAIDFDGLMRNVTGNVVIVHVTNTLEDISNVTRIVETISSKDRTVHLRTVLILSDLKPHMEIEETSVNSSIITLPTNNILGYDIARLFSNLDCPSVNKRDYYLSEPYLESYPYGKSMILSISKVTATALITVDVKLQEFVEDITYFNGGLNNHAILLDKKGIVLMHKNFPRIETLVEQPLKVYFRDMENVEERVVNEMIERPGGILDIINKLGRNVTLRWKHLRHLDLIVCVVTEVMRPKVPARPVVKQPPQLPDNLLHHRLDVVPQDYWTAHLCNYKGHIQSLSHAVVYLSPWSLKPSLIDDEDTRVAPQSYMAYIRDTTGLLANPGLSSSVRKDVAMISQILGHFKKRQEKSPSNKFIIRRYVTAVESGVVEIFPGTSLDSRFDPKRRSWYSKAMEHPGKIVLSGPYLDAAGSGYVLTLSQTIFEGRRAALHTQNDPVVAIASMDMSLGYAVRLIKDVLNICNNSTIKCFLMEDRGYLVSHPALLEPGTLKLLQQQHLTHKEHLVSTDILYHEMFVKKKVCANHLDGTIQRYYQFNTSLDQVLTNIIHGEQCVRYQVAAVPGTNLFFGVINETCASSAFCPCPTMDRLCLNCNRMEQTECECPCECSLYASGCQRTNTTSVLESCPPAFEQGILGGERWARSLLYAQQMGLAQCPISDCKAYQTEADCLGIVGCQWCSIDVDGESPLTSPFCSDTYLCFKGVLGSLFPYADGTYNSQPMADTVGKEWPSVGPVAGGILAVVLIFGITLFCYRLHSVQTGLEHQCLHLHGSPDTLRMTHLDVGLGGTSGNPRDPEPIELDRSKNNLDSLLLDNCPPISPYRVSTNYRRPAGGDSDHGYSTMTPHDDNEQQSFAEPLLLVGGANEQPELIRRSIIDSPTPTTCLDSPHRLLAPVTVHRNMETSYS